MNRTCDLCGAPDTMDGCPYLKPPFDRELPLGCLANRPRKDNGDVYELARELEGCVMPAVDAFRARCAKRGDDPAIIDAAVMMQHLAMAITTNLKSGSSRDFFYQMARGLIDHVYGPEEKPTNDGTITKH